MPNPFFDSPRIRRLRRDFDEMKVLASESSILEFDAKPPAPTEYKLTFHGNGLANADTISNKHVINLQLGTQYPSGLPSIRFLTPIIHPNISNGSPCFGTFVMNPNVRLVELVEILWDMTRMSTYNPYGGYGDKNVWQALRKQFDFPVDKRILRDKVSVPPKAKRDSGDVDLIIMSGAHMGGLPPSQIFVKAALEQYLESRGMADHVQIYTGDEWYSQSHEMLQGLVGTMIMDSHMFNFLNENTPEGSEFSDELEAFLKRLAVEARGALVPGKLYLFPSRMWS
jgi:ubiquitin-protein ligase